MKKESDEWETPPWLFKQLDDIFHFDWDACCNRSNCLVKTQLPGCNGLWENYDYLKCSFNHITVSLTGETHFMNPPYSKPRPFIQKAIELAKSNNITTVALLKYDCTKLFYEDLMKYCLLKKDWIQVYYAFPQGKKFKYGPVTIYLLPQRLKFYKKGVESKTTANFPCCIVVINGRLNV